MESKDYHKCVKQARKICKCRLNIQFMENCITEKVVPAFTRVKKEVMDKARLSKNQVRSLRFRKLTSTIKSVKQKHIKKYYRKFKKTIFVKANYLESHNQIKKNIKFDKLKKSKNENRVYLQKSKYLMILIFKSHPKF